MSFHLKSLPFLKFAESLCVSTGEGARRDAGVPQVQVPTRKIVKRNTNLNRHCDSLFTHRTFT